MVLGTAYKTVGIRCHLHDAACDVSRQRSERAEEAVECEIKRAQIGVKPKLDRQSAVERIVVGHERRQAKHAAKDAAGQRTAQRVSVNLKILEVGESRIRIWQHAREEIVVQKECVELHKSPDRCRQSARERVSAEIDDNQIIQRADSVWNCARNVIAREQTVLRFGVSCQVKKPVVKRSQAFETNSSANFRRQ